MKIKFVVFFTVILSFLAHANSLNTNSNNDNISFKISYYGKKTILSPEQLINIDNNLKIVHATFAGITYASLWALDAIGIALLYQFFTDQNSTYYDPLKYSHIGLSISALLTFATTVVLAFTKIGIKIQNKFAIKKTHFIAAFVTLGFYLLELASIILSSVFFVNKYEEAKWVGLAHGITCGATSLALTVSFITIFF
ncbi:MAG: hypothetical protein A2086_08530 [Spirochaetes bacterium GWD1_27_9]|nr:MAG: hypothetical protein A2Z98_02355 [Spirochaetes bacterium GWB1_27_13]OHD44391.1 MAG: hypothetical protein A2086_08530 [Spirochaetes bacterium GWD1_27_9]